MYKLATLLFVAILVRGCDSKIVVDHVSLNTSVPANGMIYALPKTGAKLQVKVDKTTSIGAPYSPFAAIFAPDGDRVCKYDTITKETYTKCISGQDSYSLQPGAIITTFGEPDPDQVFLVRFLGSGRIDQSLSMTWNDTGLLTAASAQVTNRTTDILVSGLKVVTGLGIKAALGASKSEDADEPCGKGSIAQDKWIVTELTKAGLNIAPALVRNYCEIKISDRRKFPERPNTPALDIKDDSTVVETLTFGDLLTRARTAYADEVYKLIDLRGRILTDDDNLNTANSDLLSHLDTEISKKLTELYLGRKKSFPWEGTLQLRQLPQLHCGLTDSDRDDGCDAMDREPGGWFFDVINIDEREGICTKAELSPDSKPIPIAGAEKFAILKEEACDKATAIKLRLNFYPESRAQLFPRITSVAESEQSFRYRVPAQVKGVLCTTKQSKDGTLCDEEKKTYGAAVFSVAQLGTIISLPATRHSKTLSYDLAFIESTGALRTFKLNSAGGLDPAMIEALGGVAGSIIEARQKGDEINKLTRMQQLLKLQDEICTIQKKYGLPCTVQPEEDK
jgi:hypothetical protein